MTSSGWSASTLRTGHRNHWRCSDPDCAYTTTTEA